MQAALTFARGLAILAFNFNITLFFALAVLLLLRPALLRVPAQPRAFCWVGTCWVWMLAGSLGRLVRLPWGLQGLLSPRATSSGLGPEYLPGDWMEGVTGKPMVLPGGVELPAPTDRVLWCCVALWLAGALALNAWCWGQNIRLRRLVKRQGVLLAADDPAWALAVRQVRDAQVERMKAYECQGLPTSFVNGSAVYLQAGLPAGERRLVLLHEAMHVRLGHCYWKYAFFTLCTFCWFDPLVWAAYRLFCRDLEEACDDAVLRVVGPRDRADYAQALLHAASGRYVWGQPAFGEADARLRIRRVLSWRDASAWRRWAGWGLAALLTLFFTVGAPVSAWPGDARAGWPQAALRLAQDEMVGGIYANLAGRPGQRPNAVYCLPAQPLEEGQADPQTLKMYEGKTFTAQAWLGMEYPGGVRAVWQCLYAVEDGGWHFTPQQAPAPGSWQGWQRLA